MARRKCRNSTASRPLGSFRQILYLCCVPSDPKDLPLHIRGARLRLDHALDELCKVDPLAYYERKGLVESLDYGAKQWQSVPTRLPFGVSLNELTDGAGDTFYTIHWGPRPILDAVPFYDRALAVATVWTVFSICRPWAIDDQRLRTLVDDPPMPPAGILASLLSLRFSAWIRHAVRMMALKTAKEVPGLADEQAVRDIAESFTALDTVYESRAATTIYELSCTFDVLESESTLGYELHRWRWMLFEYSKLLDPAFHVSLERLHVRLECEMLTDTTKAWKAIFDRRVLDGCMGVLLTRAAMLDTRHQPDVMTRFVDPLAKRARGSFAWWCQWMIEAVDEDPDDGDRLKPDDIETYTGMATRWLEELDPVLLEGLRQAFPSLRR